jgi:DNA/RNA endonuclease YhcR with UshA esterase domain
MKNGLMGLAVGVALALPAVRAVAHHSFSAEFDIDKPLKMTGTVTNVEWRNPHAWFYIDVKDESGNVTNWGLELASPNLLMRNGWSKSSMKIGDVVTVEGFHAKADAKIGNARTVMTADGRNLFTGSSAPRSQP